MGRIWNSKWLFQANFQSYIKYKKKKIYIKYIIFSFKIKSRFNYPNYPKYPYLNQVIYKLYKLFKGYFFY